MEKCLLLILAFMISFKLTAQEQESPNSATLKQSEILNYVNPSSQHKDFTTVDEMVTYLKEYRLKTYFYYQKLDEDKKRKTFVEHIDFPEKDITMIILNQYSSKS